MSEKDLARAVLLQAFFDATSKKTSRFPKHKCPTKQEKQEAKDFLTNGEGYEKMLELWCSLAEVRKSCVIACGNKIKKEGR